MSDINKEQGLTLRARDTEIKMLHDQLEELEGIKLDYLQSLADAKAAKARVTPRGPSPYPLPPSLPRPHSAHS